MKIHSLSITNFRGYRNTVTIPFDDLTVFVGKNDVGKSTILAALDIFFHDGEGLIKIEKNDVNIKEAQIGNEDTIISVEFEELPDQVVIDTSSTTSLRGEYLLNDDHRLEIVKKYHNGGSPKVFIRAKHPTNVACADLLLKKNTELKTIVRNNNIPCENQTNNVKLREAIWNYFNEDLQLQNCEIDASKEDAKRIWDKLSSYMPVYSLFQADRENSDSDNEIQDPLQVAVKQILNDQELQTTLERVAEVVTQKLQEVSARTLEKLREMDPTVANSLNPMIPTAASLKWADVFKKVSISGDENIPINKRGSGVKRLVLLNFFRAEAERRYQAGDNTGVIYAIEEPETSQHAANQRVLIRALKTLASSPQTQVILTTHSGIIVKELEFSNLRLVSDVADEKQVLPVERGVLHYPSLNEVNYTAFGEVTEEYHNELYGFLDLHRLIQDYKQGKQQVQYDKENRDGDVTTLLVTRTEKIRHQIHHPENTHNTRFSNEELQNSIEEMRVFIRNRPGTENDELWDDLEDF